MTSYSARTTQSRPFSFAKYMALSAAASSASCWLLMNLFWMLGESYTQPGLILTAQLVGAVAVGLLGVSVWSGGIGGPVMQQFRRIKVG